MIETVEQPAPADLRQLSLSVNAHFQTVILAFKDHARANICRCHSLFLIIGSFFEIGKGIFRLFLSEIIEVHISADGVDYHR